MLKVLAIAGAMFTALALAPAAPAGNPISNPNFTEPPAKDGYSYPDCYCTDSNGKRVELGETACLKIGSRRFLARCDISVNNSVWREESEGCPGV